MLALDTPIEMKKMSVAEVAMYFPQAIDVLNRYQLDYCCNGKKSFVEECSKGNFDAEQIWNEILEAEKLPRKDGHMSFNTWKPGLLIDYIVQHHHAYVRESIPRIQNLLAKVSAAHGSDEPDLLKLQTTFDLLAEELMNHLTKEEVILFPAIRRLTESNLHEEGNLIHDVQLPLTVMEREHDDVGVLIKSIRVLTNQYTPSIHACPTYKLAFKLLNDFDLDLLQHIHLENNILFPKIKPARS